MTVAPPVVPTAPPPVADDPIDVVEPVVSVHRFPGRFLHATADRVTFLGTDPNGSAVVVGRRLNHPRPPLVDEDDGFRTPVPAGEAMWCADHVVVTGAREAFAVGPDGKVEWVFTLPGRPDEREALVGVLGVDGAKVLIASQFTPAADDKDEKPVGRVFWFDRTTGRMTDCVTFPGGFGAAAPLLDLQAKNLYAVLGGSLSSVHGGALCYDLGTGQKRWSQRSPRGPVGHPAASSGGVLFSTDRLEFATAERREMVADSTLTAPAAVRDGLVYAGLKGAAAPRLAALNPGASQQHVWSRNLPAEVATTPVVSGASVYAVAGKVLYRLDRKTGATCWKKTLPLNDGEAVDGFTRSGDELWVSGKGFLVKVRNEPEPTKPPADADPKPVVPFAPPSVAPEVGGR
jgi:outer membrane protein assembly factor BamB